jgi:hypothetical protein
MKLLFLIFIFAIIFNNCPAQEEDPNVIFEERLREWVEAANIVDDNQDQTNIARLNDAFRDLRIFTRQHPENKYADDAEFIRYKSTEVTPDKWDEFLAKYPSGKTEDFTREQLAMLKGMLAGFAFECLIPYELLPLYTRGQLAWLSDDFQEAEKNLADFLQKIEIHYPDLTELSPEPYIKLLMTYKSLDKRKEYDKIKEKVFILFPAKREFAENLWP